MLLSRCTKLREDMFIEGARALARTVAPEDVAAGALVPPVADMRDVAGALRGGRAGDVGWGSVGGALSWLGGVQRLVHPAAVGVPWCGAGPGHSRRTLSAPLPPTHTPGCSAAAHVAAAVAGKAYHGGVATELPRPHDLLEKAYHWMYQPTYRRYR